MADHKSAEELFLSNGMDERRTKETLKNAKLTEALVAVIKEAHETNPKDVKEVVNLLYTIASSLAPEAVAHRKMLVNYVATKKIDKVSLPGALAFLKKVGANPLTPKEFEAETGVGVTITKEDVVRETKKYFEEIKAQLLEEKYAYPINSLLTAIKERLKFANPKDIKDAVDTEMLSLLGPRVNDGKKKAAPKKPAKEEAAAEPVKELITFPDPKDNTHNKPDILAAHLKQTGGKVICRFPPEPNGYLHAGHAKSMNLNFGYPKKSGGITYLRFDDTNPEAEKLEYIESIIEDVKWLGHTPFKITYSSDYFPQLYELAVQLIKNGKAYVCHQTADEIKAGRKAKVESPWRNRPIEESLRLFEDMKKGKFEEGAATLRMKMDMQSDNTVMRDLIAYRIKYAPHPHVGDRWCIYPSYDYTHCIIDSLENITHSLCTLEFEVRRESYYRLLDDLGLYKPLVWEYSRLNLSNVVLSKRKLIKLVRAGYVKGWDDPRLPTLRGFRRRGYTPDAINDVCDRVGVTRADNVINYNVLEQCVREDLDKKCNRALAVLEPLKVTLVDWDGKIKSVSAPNHPKDKERGTRSVPFSGVIYIEKTDFRLEDSKGYKRLAPNKEVGLMHAGFTIFCTEVVKDSKGNVVELKAKLNTAPSAKPQGYINWVAEPSPGQEPFKIETRLYDRLFKSEEPGKMTEEQKENLSKEEKEKLWIDDLNPNSLVVTSCFVEPSVKDAKVGDALQFERLGYFCKDPDSTATNHVWNRVVTLKEANWEK